MVLEEAIEFIDKVNNSKDYYIDNYESYKFKLSVRKKLIDMIGYSIKSISPNFRKCFKKVYNTEVRSSTGYRTLVWNNNVIYTAKITSATFSLVEYILMDVVADLIMAQPNYISGKSKPMEIFTIGGHLHRIFGYSDNTNLNATIENRLRKQFGAEVEVTYEDIPLQETTMLVRFEAILHHVIIKTIEVELPAKFRRYCSDLSYSRNYGKVHDEIWMYLLQQLPDWNGKSRQEETNEMKLQAISNVISSKLPSVDKLTKIRHITSRKYTQ